MGRRKFELYSKKISLYKSELKGGGMKVIKSWEISGIEVPQPYQRIIKVLLAPDLNGIEEYSVSQAIIYPKSKTDNHIHDRKELIYIVSGKGYCINNKERVNLELDMLLLIEEGEEHQIFNDSDETMKLLIVFVPPQTAEYLSKRPIWSLKSSIGKEECK